MSDLPCPNCGSDLSFVEQYGRHYCYHCGRYAPEGYGDRGAKRCPTCGGILSYVQEYDRFYCHGCDAYASLEAAAPETSVAAAAGLPSSGSTDDAMSEWVEVPPEAAQATAPSSAGVPTSATGVTPAHASQSAENEETTAPQPTSIEDGAEAVAGVHDSTPATPLAAVRVKVFAMRKAELVDLCKRLHLDPSGTKEQVRDRLLSHLEAVEARREEDPDRTRAAEESHEGKAQAPVTIVPSTGKGRAGGQLVAPTMPAEGASAGGAAGPMVITVPAPTPSPTLPQAEAVPERSAPRQRPGAQHPCPRCGRELTYIPQYRRWYCYSCQRYAPGAKARFACPTCGGPLRWIAQYERWWCDACASYASADLPHPVARPRPAASTAEPSAAAPTTAGASVRATSAHAHRSPASGIGLVGFGLALYVVFSFFAYFGPLMGVARPAAVSAEILAVLQFFAFLLVSVGAIVGLVSLRHQQ